MKKSIVVGISLSLIGTALIIGTVLAAIQASNTLNINDATAVHNFATFLTDQIGPIFFAGIGLLGIGLLILVVKFLLWTSQTPKQE